MGMFYTPDFSAVCINLNSLAPVRSEQLFPFVPVLSFVLAVTSSTTMSSLPRVLPRMTSLVAPKTSKCERPTSGQYGGRGRAVRLYSVISSRVFKFFLWSCVVVLEENFSNIFVRPKSPEEAFSCSNDQV